MPFYFYFCHSYSCGSLWVVISCLFYSEERDAHPARKVALRLLFKIILICRQTRQDLMAFKF